MTEENKRSSEYYRELMSESYARGVADAQAGLTPEHADADRRFEGLPGLGEPGAPTAYGELRREAWQQRQEADMVVFNYIHEHGLAESMLTTSGLGREEDVNDYDEETVRYHLGVWQAARDNADAPDGFRAFADDQIERWQSIEPGSSQAS